MNRRIFFSFVVISGWLLVCSCSLHVTRGGERDAPQLPALRVSEYILGTGDEIEIAVYRHDDLRRTTLIDASGRIMFPLVGDVEAAGLSIFSLRDSITAALARYVKNPQVSIRITSMQSQKVFVLGEVRSPGIFTMDRPTSLIEAIVQAGGFTADAKKSNIVLIRGGLDNPQLMCLNLQKFLSKVSTEQNVLLHRGDIVYVPTSIIANVQRFFDRLDSVIRPLYTLERGIVLEPALEDVFSHRKTNDSKQTIVIGQ